MILKMHSLTCYVFIKRDTVIINLENDVKVNGRRQ